jgi:hypothetical protein
MLALDYLWFATMVIWPSVHLNSTYVPSRVNLFPFTLTKIVFLVPLLSTYICMISWVAFVFVFDTTSHDDDYMLRFGIWYFVSFSLYLCHDDGWINVFTLQYLMLFVCSQ